MSILVPKESKEIIDFYYILHISINIILHEIISYGYVSILARWDPHLDREYWEYWYLLYDHSSGSGDRSIFLAPPDPSDPRMDDEDEYDHRSHGRAESDPVREKCDPRRYARGDARSTSRDEMSREWYDPPGRGDRSHEIGAFLVIWGEVKIVFRGERGILSSG